MEMLGGTLSAKQLQKYIFLFTRQQQDKTFAFIPYKYGSFSFQIEYDMKVMCNQGLLNIMEGPEGTTYDLKTENSYIKDLKQTDYSIMRSICTNFGKFSTDELIKYTYIHYPYFAIKSIIAQQLLNQEEFRRIQQQKRQYKQPTLFTIGYEGLSLEAYINKLILNDIRVLCDVRKNAYSQKFGFSKAQLKQACEGVGIKYIHIPELGIESEKRQALLSQNDYNILFEEYEKEIINNKFDYILYVKSIIERYKRVALTCFEHNPAQCHRSKIAKLLMNMKDKEYNMQLL